MNNYILVTGANGFLGKNVMNILPEQEKLKILAPSSRELDLTSHVSVDEYFKIFRPKVVLHMAATCGGIKANKTNPAIFIQDNLKMSVNLFDAIDKYNTEYYYGLGSVCSYPVDCPAPFKEDDMWLGRPERTNEPYGQAKRIQYIQFEAFKKQFGLKGAFLVPVNLFGLFDHFDLENSHVIPALIRKFVEAKESNKEYVEVWGTGNITREFLYAEDAAEAIVKAVTTRLDYIEPINIGTGKEISIIDLANLISNLTGYQGQIKLMNNFEMNGQPRRVLDVSRAKFVLDFTAKTSLEEGLNKTIQWYIRNKTL